LCASRTDPKENLLQVEASTNLWLSILEQYTGWAPMFVTHFSSMLRIGQIGNTCPFKEKCLNSDLQEKW
jgi:hypothetical protein